VLLGERRYLELEAWARNWLATQPASGIGWQLLAAALAQQGKDALEACRKAVDCIPDDAAANVNLANAYARQGRVAEAAAGYQKALAIDPEHAQAHCNLARLQLDQDLLHEAVRSCQQALRSQPEFAEAYRTLGQSLARLGCFADAVASCRRAIDLSPNDAQAHNTLGGILLELSRFDEAAACFQQALAIQPAFPAAHANLGNVLRSTGQLDAAVVSYRRALAYDANLVSAHVELATALRLQRRTVEAESACRRALELDKDCAAGRCVLAELEADRGRFARAEQLFQQAAATDPACAEAWAATPRLRRMTPGDSAWLEQVRRLAESAMPPHRQLLLWFALGKYYDDVGDFASAFASYRRANELGNRCGPAYDRRSLERMISQLLRHHDRDAIHAGARGGNPTDRPVFVVGMLRSGTTLAEQILAHHPSVFGAGELTFWTTEHANRLRSGAGADIGAAIASAPWIAELGARYVDVLHGLSAGASRVVDKMPTNFLFLGLICMALPNAKIIHLTRDPRDTCLSIYFQQFDPANSYTRDLGDLAHYYGQYRRLMHHWRCALPAEAMLEVPYESLVRDTERWSRRMVDFIGLPWHSGCLEFDAPTSPVVTASKWQVRQKIYTSSVGRWRRYQAYIAQLLPLVDGIAQDDGA
jgi:tetratricopeptide (TPR) repeat protein